MYSLTPDQHDCLFGFIRFTTEVVTAGVNDRNILFFTRYYIKNLT